MEALLEGAVSSAKLHFMEECVGTGELDQSSSSKLPVELVSGVRAAKCTFADGVAPNSISQ